MLKPTADREHVLKMLEHEGGVTEESVRKVSKLTNVPEADVWGAGLFYTLINKPGRRVRVCDGLTCQMAGATELAKQLEEKGKRCEMVSCLAQCDRAPATLDEDLELITYEGKPTGVTPDDPELPMNLAGPVDRSYASLSQGNGDRRRESHPRNRSVWVAGPWRCGVSGTLQMESGSRSKRNRAIRGL